MLKIRDISLFNFAKFNNITVSFDENITYLMGENEAGKTSLGLMGIWYIFQGIAEKAQAGNHPIIAERFRFIGNNGASAKGILTLFDTDLKTEIKIMRRMTKDAHIVTFEAEEGKVLDQNWLNSIFNLFMISPTSFWVLAPKDQALALGIDTKSYDNEIKKIAEDRKLNDRVLKEMGTLIPVPAVEPVDFADLSKQKDEIIAFNKAQTDATRDNAVNAETIKTKNINIDLKKNEIKRLQAELIQMENSLKQYEKDFQPAKVLEQKTEELAKVNKEILDAGETNDKANKYKTYLANKLKADDLTTKSNDFTKKINKKKEERLTYIKNMQLPFKELSINDDGELLFDGKYLKEEYFSTGELLMITTLLMGSKQPELRYVYLQHFNLMDDKTQEKVIKYLIEKNYQLVIEYVGKKETDAHIIHLKECKVADSEDSKGETNSAPSIFG
jgi:hypothetical protein